MNTNMRAAFTFVTAFTFAVGAQAAPVIWDYSPDTTGASIAGSWSNIASGQNFQEGFVLTTDTVITGMDNFSGSGFGSIGDTATIRVFSDAAGSPGTKLFEFTETITAVDTIATTSLPGITRKHVAFSTPISLTAGSYFIGMSGTGFQLALTGLNTPDDGGMWQMSGDTVSFFASTIGDMAFRLFGDETSVPAPGAIALLGFGLLGLGMRRRTS